MIRALLDGRKTQTRRVLKLNGARPAFCGGRGDLDDPTCWGWEDTNHGDWITLEKDPGQRMGWRDWVGAPRAGDRLWVREAWQTVDAYEDVKPSEMGGDEPILYVADDYVERWGWPGCGGRWGRKRASIHMPRWASRLTLTVTDVRVEPVQAISAEDAKAEGLTPDPNAGALAVEMGCNWTFDGDSRHGSPVSAFAALWDSLNEPRGYGWQTNPWVIAYTFTLARQNIDATGAKMVRDMDFNRECIDGEVQRFAQMARRED
tara:strand:- start:272 stop:1054 length:783 start_codon:yes stop_codon:yes gene_type:complete